MYDKRGNRFPDFLIVGAAKSGTTSLYYFLCDHPRIFLPSRKEPHFLGIYPLPKQELHDEWKEWAILDYDRYVGLYQSAPPDMLVGDCSTTYLPLFRQCMASLTDLVDEPSDVKIIIMLREPVARMYSHYLMKVAAGRENLSFGEATDPRTIERRMRDGYDMTFDYVLFSRYSEPVEYYMNNFKNVHVMIFERFKKDPHGALGGLAQFLGVDGRWDVDTSKRYREGGVPAAGGVRKLIHRMFFTQNPVTKNIRTLLPESLRLEIRRKIGRIALDSAPPLNSLEGVQRIWASFREDIGRVREILGDPIPEWDASYNDR